jgi:hypothetical protein
LAKMRDGPPGPEGGWRARWGLGLKGGGRVMIGERWWCRATLSSRSNLEIGADGAPVVSQDQPGFGFGGHPLICRVGELGTEEGWVDGLGWRMPKRFVSRARDDEQRGKALELAERVVSLSCCACARGGKVVVGGKGPGDGDGCVPTAKKESANGRQAWGLCGWQKSGWVSGRATGYLADG